MLEGFNCTIFAYGQTGTGKTHTMQGESGGGLSSAAGVIPRAVAHIFASLEAAKAEYSVKCTFLELCACLAPSPAQLLPHSQFSILEPGCEPAPADNEEITDLLSGEEEAERRAGWYDAERRKLALMEDGKGGVMVKGLEEVIVSSAAEIFAVLDRGTAKRRTAETLLNKQSSRSHSVFAVTIHIKELTVDGEELIKARGRRVGWWGAGVLTQAS